MNKLYCIAVLLPDTLEELILQLKTEIAGRFNSVAALGPTGQISVQGTFLYDDQNIDSLADSLESVLAFTRPFEVELQDFGAFPSHTIFAAIRNFFPFQALRDILFRRLRADRTFPQAALGSREITPHVAVAYRDLAPEKFEAAWNEFSQRELDVTFTASSAHLMEHRGKWRAVREFPFLGLASPARSHLELFSA